jgi:hypothetical protein
LSREESYSSSDGSQMNDQVIGLFSYFLPGSVLDCPSQSCERSWSVDSEVPRESSLGNRGPSRNKSLPRSGLSSYHKKRQLLVLLVGSSTNSTRSFTAGQMSSVLTPFIRTFFTHLREFALSRSSDRHYLVVCCCLSTHVIVRGQISCRFSLNFKTLHSNAAVSLIQ